MHGRVKGLALLLAIAIVFVSGIGQAASPVELSIWVFGGTIPDRILPVIDLFNKKDTGIRINPVVVPIAQMETQIITAASGNKLPDMCHYWPLVLKPFVDKGITVDLTSYLTANDRAWYNSFIPGVIDYGKYNNKYYGISESGLVQTMFYNKSAFASAGVSEPKTFDQFMADLKKIKEKTSMFPIAVPGAPQAYPEWWLRNFVGSFTKQAKVFDELNDGKLALNSKPFIDSIDYYKKFYDTGCWTPGSFGMTADDTMALFLQGKAAITTHVNTALTTVKTSATFNYGVFTPPPPAAAPIPSYCGSTNCFFISKGTQHVKECIEFLKFLTSMEAQGDMATRISGFVPVIKGINFSDPIRKYIVDGLQDVTSDQWWSLSPKIGTYCKQNLPLLCDNKMTTKAFADGLEAIRQEALAASK